MKRFSALFRTIVLSVLSVSGFAQEGQPLNFQEVFNLVRTNLTDISEPELSRLAAAGLIKELGTKVQLLTNNASAPEPPDEVISRRAIYEDSYPYLQVRLVDGRLPTEFQKWLGELTATNSARGLVIDLRYAQGEDYEAAARIADFFAKGGEPLLKLGTRQINATDETKTTDLPVAVLANGSTRGAAEALAALLRTAGAGLVIGSTTAGEARLFETFTLSTGQRLKIGTVPVEVGPERKPISSKGLTPDIAVTVNPAAERVLYQDPYRMISAFSGQIPPRSTNEVAGATNRTRRFNEAELVRRHRAGGNLDDLAGGAPVPEEPIISDPVLARALDFLKGISALQQHRP